MALKKIEYISKEHLHPVEAVCYAIYCVCPGVY